MKRSREKRSKTATTAISRSRHLSHFTRSLLRRLFWRPTVKNRSSRFVVTCNHFRIMLLTGKSRNKKILRIFYSIFLNIPEDAVEIKLGI